MRPAATRRKRLKLPPHRRQSLAQLSKEEKIDQNKQYNVMTLVEIENLIPNTPYAQIIRSTGVDKAKKIVVQ